MKKFTAGSKFNILLGSRSPSNLIYYNLILKISRYNLHIARNEMEVIRKATDSKPDIIILNNDKGFLDGPSCCQKLKSLSATRDIPTIILGDSADKMLVLSALKAGANDFIVRKGKYYESLLKRLERLLNVEVSQPEKKTVATSGSSGGKRAKRTSKASSFKEKLKAKSRSKPDTAQESGAGPSSETGSADGKALLSPNELKKRLAEITDIKAMPFVVTQILDLISEEESDVQEIVGVIEKDPAISSKILHYANSSFFSITGKIESLSTAIMRIGFKGVTEIVMGMKVLDILMGGKEKTALDRYQLWEHSLGCAVFSNLIAKAIGYKPHEDALLAGLFHDVGKAILDEFMGDEYQIIVKTASDKSIKLHSVEKKLIHINHTGVGKHVIESWKLPEKFLDPVEFHHHAWGKVQGMLQKDRRLVGIVWISNILAKAKFPSFGGDDFLVQIPDELVSFLGLHESMMEPILLEVNKSIAELKTIMSIPTLEEQKQDGKDEFFHGRKALIATRKGLPFSLPAIYLEARGLDVMTAQGNAFASLLAEWSPDLLVFDCIPSGTLEKVYDYLAKTSVSCPVLQLGTRLGKAYENIQLRVVPESPSISMINKALGEFLGEKNEVLENAASVGSEGG